MNPENNQNIYKEECIKVHLPYQDSLNSIFNTDKYKIKVCAVDEEMTLIILRPKEYKPKVADK